MKNDQLTHNQIARVAKRAARALECAEALAHELPTELGTSCAEHFAQSAMEYVADALADLAKIKRSLHLERIREKPSLREYLKQKAQLPRVHVPVPMPVRPYNPGTAIVAAPVVTVVAREERAA